ncbi:MAG: sensor histidine kinase, partial [Bacteroidetes bacterium]|nr:sensor histidine kinase [Bacteroidota bacterium]
MPDANQQITSTIIAGIFILLFVGVLFIAMIVFYNYRRRLTAREKIAMKAQFDQQLMQARLEVQEQAFTHISEEIHDNVGQLLSLAKMQLSAIGESDLVDHDTLMSARENVARSIRELRNLSKSLHTGHIRALGIRQAAEEEGQRINRAGPLLVSVTSEGSERDIAEDKQLILFRIIQECLQNCVKHAGATSVNIGFTWYPDQLRVRVRDDGKGFDPEVTLKGAAKGLGLQNIRNRARLTGGSGIISSKPGEGTTVT